MGALVGCVIGLVPALALTVFGLGTGYGQIVPTFLFRTIGFVVSVSVFSGLVGAPIGFIGALIQKVRRRRSKASTGAEADRPTYSLRSGEKTALPVDPCAAEERSFASAHAHRSTRSGRVCRCVGRRGLGAQNGRCRKHGGDQGSRPRRPELAVE